MDSDSEDPVIARLPIRLSHAMDPDIQIHHFPLLNAPLQVPPQAAAAGKRITARLKPNVRRLEMHVPVDTRPEVWNDERASALGVAQVEDDRGKNQEVVKVKQRKEEEPRLSEVRMQSEQILQKGAYMVGIVRDGQLHLHPINETYQLRPTLTYLDVYSQKSRHRGDDSDSDDGPPPDPDDPVPVPVAKEPKKAAKDAKEIQVAAKRGGGDDKGLGSMQGGLSQARREMLMIVRAEEDEAWVNYQVFGGETAEATETLRSVVSKEDNVLQCTSSLTGLVPDVESV